MSKRQQKIGRNTPCPCGSGKKFKKCHGAVSSSFTAQRANYQPSEEIKKRLLQMEAQEKQRQRQQGLGRPIISTIHHGYRIVAVGGKLHWSEKWKTFHDFLVNYISQVMGGEWGNAEIKKPFKERHPILQWYHMLCDYQRETIKKPGEVHSAPMTGAISAYLGLAYNLYLLAHNIKIQSRLVQRLKDPRQFQGALYETYVAAAFIKAGFDLEFENEDDTSTTHCEFAATRKESGIKYSVEAKSRAEGKPHAKINNQLYEALRKEAKYKRVIFIDVNVPERASSLETASWLEEALKSLRDKESVLTINGTLAPEAYVFVTNHPYSYNLKEVNIRGSAVAEGFKIPDFKLDSQFASLRDVLKVREKHADMFHLMSSLRAHYEIPSTFDGEMPEFAFGKPGTRLIIGRKYSVPLADGTEMAGELNSATVAEDKKLAYCGIQLEDGRAIIATCPLTDEELTAYRKNKDTFFGMYTPHHEKLRDPIDYFDFFYESYRHTSKERLLELLHGHSDLERLSHESQEEIAITYCEGLVYSIMKQQEGSQKPQSQN